MALTPEQIQKLSPEEQAEYTQLQKDLAQANPAPAQDVPEVLAQPSVVPPQPAPNLDKLTPAEQAEYAQLKNQIAKMQGVHESLADTGKGVIQKVSEALDTPGGIARAGIAKAYDSGAFYKTPGVNDIYKTGDFEKAMQGQGPSATEYLARTGMNPNDLKTKLMGAIGNTVTDPLMYANPLSEVGDAAKGLGEYLKASQGGSDIAQSLKTLLGKTLNGAGTLVKNPLTGVLPETSTLGQTISGTPKDILQQVYKNPEVLRLADQGPTAINNAMDLFHQNLKQVVGQQRNKIGKMLSDEIGSAGGKVDTQPIRDKLKELIDEYESTKDFKDQPLNKEAIQEVRDAYKSLFGEKKYESVPIHGEMFNGQPIMRKQLVSDEIPRYIDPQAALDMQQQVKDLADYGSLGQGINSRFGATETQASKALKSKAGEAYQNLNDQFSNLTNGKSAELKKAYADFVNNQKILSPAFKSPTTSSNSVRNIGNAAKDTVLNALEKLDDSAGTNLSEQAKNLRAASFIQRAPLEPVSGQGVTSTGRQELSMAAGHTLGMEHGTPIGIGGMLLGKTVASPKVMGNISDIGGRVADIIPDGLKELGSKFGNRLDQRLLWNEMLKQEQQKKGK